MLNEFNHNLAESKEMRRLFKDITINPIKWRDYKYKINELYLAKNFELVNKFLNDQFLYWDLSTHFQN